MKKSVLLLLPFILLTSCSKPAYSTKYDDSNYELLKGNYTLDKCVSNIDITYKQGLINIIKDDSVSFIKIEEITDMVYEDRCLAHYKIVDDTLYLSYALSDTVLPYIITKSINIYIPSSNVLDKIDLESFSSEISIKNISCADIEIETKSGNINIDNSSINSLDIDTISGNTNVVNSSISEIEVESTSGNTLLDLDDNVTYIKIESTSGEASIALPSTISGYLVKFTSISGKYSSEFDETKKKEYQDESIAISYKGSSGGLNILKK